MLMSIASRRNVLDLVDALDVLVIDLELRAPEVERLIGIRPGVWPITDATRQLWWPTVRQAERIVTLFEVCAAVVDLMGADARIWMRRRNDGLGCTPISYMLACRGAVANLRAVLRVEQGAC